MLSGVEGTVTGDAKDKVLDVKGKILETWIKSYQLAALKGVNTHRLQRFVNKTLCSLLKVGFEHILLYYHSKRGLSKMMASNLMLVEGDIHSSQTLVGIPGIRAGPPIYAVELRISTSEGTWDVVRNPGKSG